LDHTLTLSPLTNIAILVMALGQLLLVGAVVFLAFKLKTIVSDTVKQALNETLPRVQPVIDNVTGITSQVSDVVKSVAPKVERMASDGESAVHNVTSKVKTTSSIVTEGIAKPMANIAALLTGVQRGITVWKTAKATQGGAARAMEADHMGQPPGADS
jgi:predicted PurR-regulated permease PerM